MDPLYIAVCEDQPQEREVLLEMLRKSGFPCVPTVFDSAEALLAAWESHTFDLLLMDIYMNGMTGVEAVKLLRFQWHLSPAALTTP